MATIQGFIFPDLPTLVESCSQWSAFQNNRVAISLYPALGGAFRTWLFNGMEQYADDPLTGISPQNALAGATEYHEGLMDMFNTLGTGGGGTSAGGMAGWFWYLQGECGWLGGAKPESCFQGRSTNMLMHEYANIDRWDYYNEMQISASFGQVILDLQSDVQTLAEAEEEISDLNNQSTQNFANSKKSLGELEGSNFARYVEMATIGGAVLILAYTGYKTLKNK